MTIVAIMMATEKKGEAGRKPTEAERDEAFKDYRRFRGKFKQAVMALSCIRLQRCAGLSYVEACVESRWKYGGGIKSIAEYVGCGESDVWVIGARAERKVQASRYSIDWNLLTWLSQNSSFLTYDPSQDPLFGDVSEFYRKYSREATAYDDVYVPRQEMAYPDSLRSIERETVMSYAIAIVQREFGIEYPQAVGLLCRLGYERELRGAGFGDDADRHRRKGRRIDVGDFDFGEELKPWIALCAGEAA